MKDLTTILFIWLVLFTCRAQSTWKAPESANSIKSPIVASKSTINEGKASFNTYCALCHGYSGRGDGVAGVALVPKPGDFTKPAFKQQTDGAIYWKITNGNPPMAPYKGVLKEDEIWKIIQYIKTF